MGRSHYAHARQPDSKLSKYFLDNSTGIGKTSAMLCGPVMRYKDALKVNLKQCGIDPSSALGDDTQDRSAWRTLCHEAVTQFEDSRVEALAHKRAVRKGAQPRSNLSAWPCDSCPRVCSSRIGTPRPSTNSPMTYDLSFFSTAQSVPSVSCFRFSRNRKAVETSDLVETQCWTTVTSGANLRSKLAKDTWNENVKIVFSHIYSSKVDRLVKQRPK